MKKRMMTLISVCFLLLCWQGIALWVGQPELVPGLPQLIETFWEMLFYPGFYLSVGATILRGLTGMALSLFTATLLSLLFARYEWIHDLFRPLLTIMRSVPVISFILLALIFLHTESIPLLIGFLTMFPLLTENLTKGLRSLHPGYSVMSRSFLLTGRNKALLVIYPQLKPFLFSGLASAAGFGWRAVVMGEVLAQTSWGIGNEMKRAQSFIDVSLLIGWTIVAVLISYLSDKIIRWLGEQKFSARYTRKPELERTDEIKDIQLQHAAYKYGASDYACHFKPEIIYGISAPSGTGKTTLLNLINGTLPPVRGSVTVDRSKGFASVFQDMELLPNLTAEENILLPVARYLPREEALRHIQPILEVVEMASFVDRYPTELSYGQQQRIAIARALAFPSPYLLMDEPFKGIDEKVIQRIIRFIRERREYFPQVVLFTSHNQEELRELADEVMVL